MRPDIIDDTDAPKTDVSTMICSIW